MAEPMPARVQVILRVIGAALLSRRTGDWLHLERALSELEMAEPEWVSRLESRAALLASPYGP